jgi:hypothetical protein
MGYITVNQIPNSFWTKDIFPDEHSSIAPGKAGIYAYNFWGGGIFQKTNGTRVYGRRYSQISRRNGYSAFLKLPEARFSSAPTEVFLNQLTVENPGNNCLPEAGGKW